MTLEMKKIVGLVVSALAIMTTIAGIVLIAMQKDTEGNNFFLNYLLMSLTILAGCMFIAWLPRLKSKRTSMKVVEGKLRVEKHETEADRRRTRIILFPIIALFFELYTLLDSWYQFHQSLMTKACAMAFMALTICVFVVWLIIIIVENSREIKRNVINK